MVPAKVSSRIWLVADSIAVWVAAVQTGLVAAAKPPGEPSAAEEAPQEASSAPGVLDAPGGVGVGVDADAAAATVAAMSSVL